MRRIIEMLGNFRIGVRLGFGFATVLILVCTLGVMGGIQAERINAGTRDLAENWLPSIQTLGDIRANANRLRRASMRSVIAEASIDKQAARADRDAALGRLQAMVSAYETLLSSDEERQVFAKLREALAAYLELDDRLLTLSESGADAAYETRDLALGKSSAAFSVLIRFIEDAIELNRDGSVSTWTTVKHHYEFAQASTIALIAAILAMSSALAVVLTLSVTRPLGEALSVAETVARGDLSCSLTSGRKDEVGRLLNALRRMNENLRGIVGEVRSGAQAITSATLQIATGNLDLSARTEEQAASIEQTAASLEQLTSTTSQNADNARQANQVAINASDVAAKGGSLVTKMVETMHAIDDSSKRVTDIIGVIESIAFQTNILALNAAVEAARAGEQGRGFAVVAGEVRTLAQRSAGAAKEIKALIDSSVANVGKGTLLVEQVGTTMDDIVLNVRRVTDLMGEISAATEEQTSGIGQVTSAIVQIDEVTQQNAALVEQATAASQAMKEQADHLSATVSLFTLEDREAYAGTGSANAMTQAIAVIEEVKRNVDRPRADAAPRLALGRQIRKGTDAADWTHF